MIIDENRLKSLDLIAADISRANKAIELLQSVYLERGPYSDGKISDEVWRKVRDFFHFDDSE